MRTAPTLWAIRSTGLFGLTPLTQPCIGKELPWLPPADYLFLGQFLGNLLRP